MTRKVFYTGKFRKDFKLIIKRGLNMTVIQMVMKAIEDGVALDPKYKEHPLTGDYIGNMECHIQPDWLLIYALCVPAHIRIYSKRCGVLGNHYSAFLFLFYQVLQSSCHYKELTTS